MSKFPVLDLWVKDWITDTKHLRPLERGIYMDMLLLAWMSPRCRLPNDPQKIADRLLYKPGELPPLRRIIAMFWAVDKLGKTISQKRLSKEHAAAAKRKAVGKVLAKARWDKEKKPLRNAITVTVDKNPLTPDEPPPASPRGAAARQGKRSKPRKSGTNPRALGTNPRALGTNPRALKAPPVSMPSMSMAAAQPKPINAAELSTAELAAKEREAIEFVHSMHKERK